MSKFNRHTRSQLLDKYHSDPETILECTAHYTANNGRWITFHQIQNAGETLATHINLPIFLLELPDNITKGNKVSFKALPSQYMQKGTYRGTLKPLKDQKKIFVRLL